MLQAIAPIAIAVGVDDAGAELARVDLFQDGVRLLRWIHHAQSPWPRARRGFIGRAACRGPRGWLSRGAVVVRFFFFYFWLKKKDGWIF